MRLANVKEFTKQKLLLTTPSVAFTLVAITSYTIVIECAIRLNIIDIDITIMKSTVDIKCYYLKYC